MAIKEVALHGDLVTKAILKLRAGIPRTPESDDDLILYCTVCANKDDRGDTVRVLRCIQGRTPQE